MKKTALFVFVVLLSILLISCATEYQARSWMGDGYSESRIDSNTYRVEYECNEFTSEMICDSHLFRRCAELTLKAGFDYFVMIDHYTRMNERRNVVPGHYDKVVTKKGNEEKTSYVYRPAYTTVTTNPISTAMIKMYRGYKPSDYTRNVFDAREVMRYSSSEVR